ncbi:hypothetical protein B1156_00150, partial [Enterococcus faecium]
MGATITSKGRKKNLSSLLQYAANPSKKEKCVAVSGINCSDDSEEALQEMNLVRTKTVSYTPLTQPTTPTV